MDELIGRKIVGTRTLSEEEKDNLDWWGHIPVLILDDGTEVIPAADGEGNNGGSLWHCQPGELLEEI